MSEINNGGPAFPGKRVVDVRLAAAGTAYESGMPLRDYFAAKAMQGMLAYPGDKERGSHHNNNTPDGIAKMAYDIANAMLRAREAK